MPYVHYNRTHTSERDPYDLTHDLTPDPYYSGQLVRYEKPSSRLYDLESDDGADDYPWPGSRKPKSILKTSTSKPSRALTVRKPSVMEGYNIWSYPAKETSSADVQEDYSEKHTRKYKFKSSFSSRDDPDTSMEPRRGWDFEAKLMYRRPTKKNEDEEKPYVWPAEVFRREKWERVDWEERERESGGRRVRWGDEEEEPRVRDREVRYRKLKRRLTDEWRPLSGFRHW